ncbi:MAG TPA: 4-hydroxy-tetrahydrodipicolinate synthase [Cyclobacteriaceae bacterium]|jgi:4-hydroxy-tetrahydrodipicolinate synthase|nr:4-hydroxy-tetrahydrodipicolinate synthase [Cyclobacteriaceae bacterium]
MKKLTGTGVALVTPFNSDGSIDFTSLKKLLEHTATGVDYFVVMGTTGESATLSKEERKEVLQFVVKNNPKRLPIVYGIGGNNTASVLSEIEETNFRGVSAILSVSPYYNKPSQEGIRQHFKKIADAAPIPVILYNIPGRTASNLTAETILKLAQHKNIIGIKEASGNLEQCMKIAKGKPKDFLLISGDDLFTLPLYSIGGVGVISVLANAFPVAFKKMTESAGAENYAKAAAETFKFLEINGLMYEEGNPTGIKYLLSLMKICKPHVRLPIVEPSAGLRKKIEAAFEQIKKG